MYNDANDTSFGVTKMNKKIYYVEEGSRRRMLGALPRQEMAGHCVYVIVHVTR